jgi:hypothetical protein
VWSALCDAPHNADHQPLYRQSEIFAREGIDLDRSTLAGWVGAASELVAPLIDEIRKHVLAGSKIHGDDTPVPVLAPGNGRTKTGRLWTYVRDDRPAAQSTAPAVWFAYSGDRKAQNLGSGQLLAPLRSGNRSNASHKWLWSTIRNPNYCREGANTIRQD